MIILCDMSGPVLVNSPWAKWHLKTDGQSTQWGIIGENLRRKIIAPKHIWGKGEVGIGFAVIV